MTENTESFAKDRQPFDAVCDDCLHSWTVAFMPMPLATFAEVVGLARCPSCGGDNLYPAMREDPDQ